jgi:hypothetical protein
MSGGYEHPVLPNPSMVSAVRVIGVIVVLGLLAAGATGIVAQFFEQHAVRTTTITEPVTRLVTDVSVGDVRVRTGQVGAPTRVTTTERWSFTRARTSVGESGGVLTVDGACSGDFFGACSVDLDVTVPPRTALELTTHTGDVRAVGVDGSVTATTSTGDVTLTGVSSDDVQVRTSTGDVTLDSTATAPTVQAATSTGGLTLRFTGAPSSVGARTSTGDITIRVPADARYEVTARTSTGSTEIDVPQDPASPHRIDASASTGDVLVRAS